MKWKIFSKTLTSNNKEILKILLANRGLKTKKEVEEFLNPIEPEDFIAKDLGIDAKEVVRAVKRINEAIVNNEGIIVYGDYDADGICATAILWETLYKLTKNVLPYIPERISEGYGMNRDSISNLKTSAFAKASVDKQNPQLKLIITVDHGITAGEKIKFAEELGIDVIVCDHHQLGKEKPKCAAVIHTDKICAAAISWFLAREIFKELPDRQFKPIPYRLENLDLVAIATIADLEPLVGVNRSFVKYGLEALRKTSRCGLLAIFEEAGIKKEEIGTYHVGYIIAPRLNATGRIEHALESLRLVCTANKEKARELAGKLGRINKERQLLTEETTRHAIESSKFKVQSSKLIFIEHESYNQGIIGLVAGKLVEEFYRPSIVISKGEVYSKASARSINGFNIIEAIRTQSDLLVDAGGHPMAAGFTIETTKLEILKQRLTAFADTQIQPELLEKNLKIDLKLPFPVITLELWKEIQKMSPFGLGNPEPVFMSKAIVADWRTVGSEGKHLKLTLRVQRAENERENVFSAIGFGMGKLASKLKVDQEVEIAYNLSLNKWNNEKHLELKLKDLQ
ncbi:single-stranded-DNA-specific exonuclease RecJ [Candidatus Shapirobacteria bacterium CG07_land_8_20_14_0_80_39_18]|uniref:Single-stranded-DNA-specific exonuclease RecJ n=1 Tax=Candidatus Shapirobacteria bacterium CG07_land_8_20_14_0_80_39_18 TaxID=1974882 RepID=A0A2M6YRH5_9BACT|nr:MAG: single-stranded-DNA-specific exonuclease RecJ [Candidatus Shapirobacteria bacterium CG07_land_8_20_14_0_80_39_18]